MTPSKDRKPNGRSGYGRFFVVEEAGAASVAPPSPPLPVTEPPANAEADRRADAAQVMLLRAVDVALGTLTPVSQTGPKRPPASR